MEQLNYLKIYILKIITILKSIYFNIFINSYLRKMEYLKKKIIL